MLWWPFAWLPYFYSDWLWPYSEGEIFPENESLDSKNGIRILNMKLELKQDLGE